MSEATEFTNEIAKFVGDTLYDLPAVNDDGRRFVIAVLGTDPVSELFARLKLAGGYATVFVKMSTGSVHVLPFLDPSPADVDALTLEEASLAEGESATVEDFTKLIDQTPGGLVLRLGAPGPERVSVCAHPLGQPPRRD
ncbi:hypothetical protein H8R18_01150 [Nanchangia anserum]|uniref:SseB protein N-terminal domain-containing protein n=1 Tax=Nanchangia anserum TaxID=2692125 RepID=A0A8I0GCX2_9ACTO|nr:hypothetical protein [Nanchangia anserum]MBD3689845.1 hypothetical protein [Nanchangia anserum]QOX82011.1 hypothetical protein H8R18_01150 [Nanchangia anserum]